MNLTEFYQNEAKDTSSNLLWLEDLKKNAIAAFAQQGFPSKKDEDWRYTSLNDFEKHQFSRKYIETPDVNLDESLDFADKITFLNGELNFSDKFASIIVEPLSSAIDKYRDKIEPYLNQILKSEHGFHNLNTAMLKDGLFIYVPEGIKVNKPILLTCLQTVENQATYLRNLIVTEKNSKITLIEEYRGIDNIYFTNAISEIYAGENSCVSHYKIQRESTNSFHFGTVAINQYHSSEVNSHSLSLGGKWVRSDTVVSFIEPDAKCFLNGMYLPNDAQHVDHHTLINHQVKNCTSVQDYKGILNGKSHAVFNGRVVVFQEATGTDAKQQNKNLLLAKGAMVDTKPQLEIFTDDVICTHGATVGQLDEESIFYMATRGIDREEATRYLVEGFAKDNLQNVSDANISKWMNKLLNEQLRRG